MCESEDGYVTAEFFKKRIDNNRTLYIKYRYSHKNKARIFMSNIEANVFMYMKVFNRTLQDAFDDLCYEPVLNNDGSNPHILH